MKIVNEGTKAVLTVTFRDENDALAAPTSIRYRIDDEKDGESTEVLDWTSVAAASSVDISITSSQNAILNDDDEDEIRTVTVEATHGAGDLLTGEYTFRLKSLSHYPAA